MACGFVAKKQEAQGAQKRRDAGQSYPCMQKFKHAVTRSYKRFLTGFIFQRATNWNKPNRDSIFPIAFAHTLTHNF